jgi:two-component system, LuxR family, sensor kinase FixL
MAPPERVFDSFFSTKDGRSGIGLAIGQSIIIAHGGRISGANRPNRGTHFRFAAPAAASDSGVVEFVGPRQ